MSALYNARAGETSYNRLVYTLIRDGHHREAIVFLSDQLQLNGTSRAALSLLGYCYYFVQDFVNAANCYEQLSHICPEEKSYRLYYAHALYEASLYDEAMKVCCQMEPQAPPELQGQITKLKFVDCISCIRKLQFAETAAIEYGRDDVATARTLLEHCPPGDAHTEANQGCLLYKENRFEEAGQKFTQAMQSAGYSAHLSYSVALCNYRQKRYALALKHIADIIERGIREHPELAVGMTTEGIDVHSVGNTLTLHETALVEAFNLKAAIEYQLGNTEAAKEALTDMPPRAQHEIDAVTLHNQALMNMDEEPEQGFEKLQFLIQQPSFPAEAFGNLLLLYCRYEHYDMAADLMAENADVSYRYLTPYLYQFLDALITQQTSADEAYAKFDDITSRHMESLRKLKRQIQQLTGGTPATTGAAEERVKKVLAEYDETLELYIPVLMAQAKIYWDLENYAQVEKLFRKSVEFCSEHDTWRLNVAHVLFMQENKFKEAAGFYEPLVKKNLDHLLDVNAVILANLCVSYIMTSQNEDAEELMRKIEKEEEQQAYQEPNKKSFHLCIVNLLIGTLYCSKGNYDFGIARVMKSVDPPSKKLGPDTWFYVKRCLLSLLENLAKKVVVVKDSVIRDCLEFLTQCEEPGRDIVANIAVSPLGGATDTARLLEDPIKNTVAWEARLLKYLFLIVNDV